MAEVRRCMSIGMQLTLPASAIACEPPKPRFRRPGGSWPRTGALKPTDSPPINPNETLMPSCPSSQPRIRTEKPSIGVHWRSKRSRQRHEPVKEPNPAPKHKKAFENPTKRETPFLLISAGYDTTETPPARRQPIVLAGAAKRSAARKGKTALKLPPDDTKSIRPN